MRVFVSVIGAALWGGWLIGPAGAQTSDCVLAASTSGPPRQILRCGRGVTIEALPGTNVSIVAPGQGETPTGAKVSGGAILVTVPAHRGVTFDVTTPDAVASVRGTKWFVEAAFQKTSVFVLRGRVGVRRAEGGDQVVLGSGEGVDVVPGSEPLAVKRWRKPRADALKAKFGL
jgi:hypothetical protein